MWSPGSSGSAPVSEANERNGDVDVPLPPMGAALSTYQTVSLTAIVTVPTADPPCASNTRYWNATSPATPGGETNVNDPLLLTVTEAPAGADSKAAVAPDSRSSTSVSLVSTLPVTLTT